MQWETGGKGRVKQPLLTIAVESKQGERKLDQASEGGEAEELDAGDGNGSLDGSRMREGKVGNSRTPPLLCRALLEERATGHYVQVSSPRGGTRLPPAIMLCCPMARYLRSACSISQMELCCCLTQQSKPKHATPSTSACRFCLRRRGAPV